MYDLFINAFNIERKNAIKIEILSIMDEPKLVTKMENSRFF
jgi:hypothetical protein